MKTAPLKVLILQDFFRMGGTEQQTLKFYNTLKCFNRPVCTGLIRTGGFLETKVKSFNIVTNNVTKGFLTIKGLVLPIIKLNPNLIICMGKLANIYSTLISFRFKNIKVVQTVRTGKNLNFLKKRNLRINHVLTNSISSKLNYNSVVLKNKKKLDTLSNLPAYPIKKVSASYVIKFKRKFKIKRSYTTILYIATFRFKKGHLTILNIIKGLVGIKNVYVFYIGNGVTLEKNITYAKKNKVEGYTFFIKNNQNTSVFYCISSNSVLASLQESLPNFLVESVRSHSFITCYEVAGTKECFFNNKTGLLVEFNNVRMLCNYLLIGFFYRGVSSLLIKNVKNSSFYMRGNLTSLRFNKITIS